jgi:hypothetical protein
MRLVGKSCGKQDVGQFLKYAVGKLKIKVQFVELVTYERVMQYYHKGMYCI